MAGSNSLSFMRMRGKQWPTRLSLKHWLRTWRSMTEKVPLTDTSAARRRWTAARVVTGTSSYRRQRTGREVQFNSRSVLRCWKHLLVLVYVFLGSPMSLVDLMNTMQSAQLFANGEYMVIYVDMNTYSPKEAHKYLWSEYLFIINT